MDGIGIIVEESCRLKGIFERIMGKSKEGIGKPAPGISFENRIGDGSSEIDQFNLFSFRPVFKIQIIFSISDYPMYIKIYIHNLI